MAFEKKKKQRVKIHQKHDPKDISPANDIEMAPNTKKRRKAIKENAAPPVRKAEPKPKSRLKVVKGNAARNKRRAIRSKIASAVLAVLVVAIIAIQIFSPTGFLEWSQNSIAMIGGGEMPVSLSGDSVGGLYTQGNRSYVLTDAYMYAYNRNGKEITAVQHGYLSPVLDVSAARTLLYDRGNYRLRVDSLSMNIADVEFEHEILTADISDSGYTAVALNDAEYAATVTVYDRRFNARFKTSLTSETVSCVKLSPNGRKVLIVGVSSDNGAFVSKISFYDVKSGAKLSEEKINGSMVVSASCIGKRVYLSSADSLISLNWDGGEKLTYDYSNIAYISGDGGKHLLVAYNPNEGKDDSIAILDKKGAEQSSFSLNAGFSQIKIGKDKVYTLTNNNVNVYDFDGKAVDSLKIGYEYVYLAPMGQGLMTTSDMRLVYYS